MKDFSLRRTSSREPAHKKFLNRAARAGRAILQSGTKIGLKAATLGVLDAADLDDLKSIADDIAEEASTKTGEYIKHSCRDMEKSERTSRAFEMHYPNSLRFSQPQEKQLMAKVRLTCLSSSSLMSLIPANRPFH